MLFIPQAPIQAPAMVLHMYMYTIINAGYHIHTSSTSKTIASLVVTKVHLRMLVIDKNLLQWPDESLQGHSTFTFMNQLSLLVMIIEVCCLLPETMTHATVK